MPRAVELADFRPPARHDGQAWTSVRIEETDDPVEGDWSEVEVIALDPLDEDPKKPGLRSFTTVAGEKEWYRLIFLREDEEGEPCPFAAAGFPQFAPTIKDVSAILRARTYVDGDEDDEDALAGGSQAGVFNEETNPTADEVEEIIPRCARDVGIELGRVPGELFGEARRVAALRAATEIERSYIPEQTESEQSIYQTLRITYEQELGTLSSTLQWWVLARRLEARGSE